MAITKYRIKGNAYWLDSNLQKVSNLTLAATYATLEEVDAAVDAHGTADTLYEVLAYRETE